MSLMQLGLLLGIAGCALCADTVELKDGRLVYGECIALSTDSVLLRDRTPIDISAVKNVELSIATIQRLFSREALENALLARKFAEIVRSSATLPAAVEQVQVARNPLAGVWRFESSSLSHYEEIVLTLRENGTYTKKFTGRMSSWAGRPTGGGSHDGRWQADGTVVRLSGDGNWPASTHDLRTFQRLQ